MNYQHGREARRAALICTGAVCALLCSPYCLFGTLGLFGSVAHSGIDEHGVLVIQLFGIGTGGAAIAVAMVWLSRRFRPFENACPTCGYDLTGIDGVCPECGKKR